MGAGGDVDVPYYRSPPSDLNNKILLTAIISLSIVLVLVFALHLYARCIIRRQARRRAAAIQQLSLNLTHTHYSREPPNDGLDPTAIASLPMFVFKRTESKKRDEDDAAIMECAVCLSALEDEETARLLPNCKHVFHLNCIDTWLISHSTCPICRTKAEPRLEPEPREGPAGVDHGGAGGGPAAPLLEVMEGTSDGASQSSPKTNGSISRLSSLRRILSRERSSRRIQPSISSQEDIVFQDLERVILAT